MKGVVLIIALSALSSWAGDTTAPPSPPVASPAVKPLTVKAEPSGYAGFVAEQKKQRLWFAVVFLAIVAWVLIWIIMIPRGGRRAGKGIYLPRWGRGPD